MFMDQKMMCEKGNIPHWVSGRLCPVPELHQAALLASSLGEGKEGSHRAPRRASLSGERLQAFERVYVHRTVLSPPHCGVRGGECAQFQHQAVVWVHNLALPLLAV